jgi:carboxymethylenebutenolidase
MKNPLPRLARAAALVLCAALVLASCRAPAQDWAKSILDKSPRHQEWVKVKYGAGANARTVDAFVVYPEVSHKAPVVLLIHEIFGLSDWARSMADDIAAMGYIVIAPDLLSGFGPNGGGTSSFPDQQAVIKAVSGLDPATVTADLNATADYALKFPRQRQARRHRLLLGRRTILPLRHPAQEPLRRLRLLRPSASRRQPQDHRRSRLRLLRRQRRAHLLHRPRHKNAMAAAGKKYDPVIYDGAGHGFMRAGEDPTNTNPANTTARTQALKRCKRCSKECSAGSRTCPERSRRVLARSSTRASESRDLLLLFVSPSNPLNGCPRSASFSDRGYHESNPPALFTQHTKWGAPS